MCKLAVSKSNTTNIWLSVITTILLLYVTTTTYLLMNMQDNILHLTYQLDAIYQAVDTIAYDMSWEYFDTNEMPPVQGYPVSYWYKPTRY